MAVEDKVKSIIAEQLGVEASEVTEAASFTDHPGAGPLAGDGRVGALTQ